MIRVAQPGAALGADRWPLDPDAIHYLLTVRRLAAGDAIEVFDGQGGAREARLEASEDGWIARFTAPLQQAATRPAVILCYGLPKGDKLDRVVRQATEIGVAEIRLVACERSVVRLDGDRAAKRIDRLDRIAAEAARQSGRADVPRITGPVVVDLAPADAAAGGPLRLVLHPAGGEPLEALPLTAPVEVWVGPEGGFAPAELARLDAAGAQRISLRCPVLRTETAAPLAVALVLHRLGAL